MRRPLARPLAAIIIVVSSLTGAHAHRVSKPCSGRVTVINPDSEGSSNGTAYIDDRSTTTPEVNHWVYVETNVHKGLQTGTDNILLGSADSDSCITTHKKGPGKIADSLVL